MVSSDQAEIYLLSCTSIVRDLIAGFQAGKEVSLNELRNKYAKKYKLRGVPRLVDILSAVPVEWQDRLRGALRAKPVRTASGVSMIGRNSCSSTGWLNPLITQIAVVAVMCKPHRCPHVAMTGNICV
jgi:elongator complex protein 3